MPRIKLRSGTLAELTAEDPVLLEGELCLDRSRGVIRVGDGESAWSALSDYAGPGVANPAADAVAAIEQSAPTPEDPLLKLSDLHSDVIDLGEGAAITVPVMDGDYVCAITADEAAITLTPPTSRRRQQTLSISSRTLSAHGAGVDVQDAHLDFDAPADTYPRTLCIYLGGKDADATLALSLSDASAAPVTVSLSFVGREERRVVVQYRAASASQTLDVVYTVTSATGSIYLMGAALAASDTVGAVSRLVATLGPAARYELTRDGPQEWIHWGRESASGVDRKAGVTAQLSALAVTGDTLSQVAALAPCVYSDAEPALSYEAILAGPTLHWAGGEAVALIPGAGTAELSLVNTPERVTRICAGIYAPAAATEAAAPVPTAVTVDGSTVLTSGESASYVATVYDQFGAEIVGAAIDWGASIGVVTQSGVYTAGPAGVATITATVGAVSGSVSVLISAAGESGLLSLSATAPEASAIVDLATEGPADWVHWGLALATDINRRSGVTAQIGTLTQLAETWTQTRWYGSGADVRVAWSGGTPSASEAGTYAYVDTPWVERAAGQGWTLTADADTSERVLLVLLRAYQVIGRLTVTLSDDSATPLQIDIGDLSSATYRRVALTYRAASADQSLTVRWETLSATGNIGIMAAALAAAVDPSPVALTSVDVAPATATIMEGAQQLFTAVPRDQYGRVMAPGTEVWDLDDGGAIASTGVLEGTVTADADGAGGPYTVSVDVTIEGVTVEGTAALTIEEYSAPSEFPGIAFAQSAVDSAINQAFWSAYSGTRPLGGPLQRVMLGLIARLHPTEGTRNAAAARAVATADWLLQPGSARNWSQMKDRWLFDEFSHTMTPLLCFFALCRHTPIIWDAMAVDLRARMDAFVGVWGWGVNAYCNPDHNNGANGVCFNGVEKSYSNINQNTSRHALSPVMMYYGGLTNYNAHLATYSSALLDATAGPSGYDWSPIGNIRSPAAVDSWTNGATFTATGGSIVGQTNTYHAQGVARALTDYRARAVPTDPASAAAGNWLPGPLIGTPTPAGVYIANQCDWNFALTMIDQNCSTGRAACVSDIYGHIRAGYTSPHLGENVMAQEYHLTARSSNGYVMITVADAVVPVLATLMALGWWKSPDANMDGALAKIRKALAAVRYRDNGPEGGSNWKGTDPCGMEPSKSAYQMGPYGWEIVDKMINPSLLWPGTEL